MELNRYVMYTTTLGVFGLIAQYVVVPILSKRFKLHDSTISLIDAATRYAIAICIRGISGKIFLDPDKSLKVTCSFMHTMSF